MKNVKGLGAEVFGYAQKGVKTNMTKKLLQQHLGESGITVVNYTKGRIEAEYFYNQDMYEKYLGGLNCRQGLGIYDEDAELDFGQLPDGRMVIVQKEGERVEIYKFKTVFRTTMTYKEQQENGKTVVRKRALSVRKNTFAEDFNLVIDNENIQVPNLLGIKRYLNEQYGEHTLDEDWSVYFEEDAPSGP